MSKLAKEINMNKAAVTVAADKKDARKALAQSMLDSVSGGWVNAFARWVQKLLIDLGAGWETALHFLLC